MSIKILEYNKQKNDISNDVDKLKNIIENLTYLESKEKLNEIHSIAWTIQLKAESMLRSLDNK